MNKHLLIWSS